MRTTLTLDPDVVRLIDEAVHRERRPTKQVVNDALRRGLATSQPRHPEPYEVAPHESSLQPGLDLSGFNRLADELEDEVILANSATDRARSVP
jgi:hypothetical protein